MFGLVSSLFGVKRRKRTFNGKLYTKSMAAFIITRWARRCLLEKYERGEISSPNLKKVIS